MTSEILTQAVTLCNGDNYYIEDAACLWLSITPASEKGVFLQRYGKLKRAKIKIQHNYKFQSYLTSELKEERLSERDFDDLFYPLDQANPFIDSKRSRAKGNSMLLPDVQQNWLDDIEQQTVAFEKLLSQYNELIWLFYKHANLASFLKSNHSTSHIKDMAAYHWKNQGVTLSIDSLLPKRILELAVDFILTEDTSCELAQDVSISITRNTLLRLSSELQETPSFLYKYPGNRAKAAASPHKKNLTSIVHILAKKLRYTPISSVSVGKAKRAIESHYLSIDSKTLRKYLQMDILEIQNMPDKKIHPREKKSLLTCIYAFSKKAHLTADATQKIESLLHHEGIEINVDDFIKYLQEAESFVKSTNH